MRVTKAGIFAWSHDGHIASAGWEFDMEGAPLPTATDILACILNHIAREGGLQATAPVDPVAAQGLAEDVIDKARRAGL